MQNFVVKIRYKGLEQEPLIIRNFMVYNSEYEITWIQADIFVGTALSLNAGVDEILNLMADVK